MGGTGLCLPGHRPKETFLLPVLRFCPWRSVLQYPCQPGSRRRELLPLSAGPRLRQPGRGHQRHTQREFLYLHDPPGHRHAGTENRKSKNERQGGSGFRRLLGQYHHAPHPAGLRSLGLGTYPVTDRADVASAVRQCRSRCIEPLYRSALPAVQP